MLRDELVQAYAVAQQQYALPTFDEIDSVFEIHDAFLRNKSSSAYVLRKIRRIMTDRLWSVIDYLHNFLAPNQRSLISMEETSKLTEEDKKNIGDLLRLFVVVARKGNSVEMQLEESADAQYIAEIFAFWHTHIDAVRAISQRQLALWDVAEPKVTLENYFG